MNKKIAIGAASVAAAAGIALGVTSLAEADPSTSPTSSASATAKPSTRPTHSHTPVTGDELTKVTNAVNAKISGLTIVKVMKDEDGSYDVLATKTDGSKVRIEVSADLGTITEKAGRPGNRGPGKGGGKHAHTAVTGAELTKVTNAVKAKYSGITIIRVLKDADGSYDVMATKADGTKVMIEVSADLGTFTEKAGRPGKAKGTATPTPTP